MLMIELYKIKNELALLIMDSEISLTVIAYNFKILQ